MIMETIMTNMKLHLDKALPLRGQIKTRTQVAQGAHQKREPLTFENKEEAKKGKESTQRNVVGINQSHLLLFQKVIHLKRKTKKG